MYRTTLMSSFGFPCGAENTHATHIAKAKTLKIILTIFFCLLSATKRRRYRTLWIEPYKWCLTNDHINLIYSLWSPKKKTSCYSTYLRKISPARVLSNQARSLHLSHPNTPFAHNLYIPRWSRALQQIGWMVATVLWVYYRTPERRRRWSAQAG